MLKHVTILFIALIKPYLIYNNPAFVTEALCISTQEPFEEVSYTVVATVYHSDPKQCNADFTTTADGSKIDTTNPSRLRWIAVSRDMLIKYGGSLEFGDRVLVEGTCSHLDGVHTLRDVMNKRYKNRIDFLVSKDDIYGKWENVKIVKI